MQQVKRLYLGSDHAGVALKALLVAKIAIEFPDCSVQDCGPDSEASTDYPTHAKTVALKVASDPGALGILICGSGIGMSIAANKFDGIRAALVWDATSARLCRQHNDANILCLGARLTGPEVVFDIVRQFLTCSFDTTGRHTKRLDLIREIERL